MNDSFLEDLGIVEQPQTGFTVRDAERRITRRSQSPAKDFLAEQAEWELLLKRQKQTDSRQFASSTMPKSTRRSVEEIIPTVKKTSPRNKTSDSSSKKTAKEAKSPGNIKTKNNIEKKVKHVEVKLKPVENVEILQIPNRSKISGSSRENSRLSDGSSKENSRPSDLSGENNIESSENNSKERRKQQLIDGSNNKKGKIESDGSESLAMLNAVKDIVSSYTKIESAKVMRMMQDLYINSQSNLMKQVLMLSEDIKEQNPGKDSSRFQLIVQENAKLHENITFLRHRVEELQKSQDDVDKLRQENALLKLRLHEYEK